MSQKSREATFRRALHLRSRQLRREETPAETELWEILRDRKVAALKFRRQVMLDQFIADFFCAEIQLVIEVDGGIHEKFADRDAARTGVLKVGGLAVLRFTNDEVLNDRKHVIQRIASLAAKLRAKAEKSP